MITIEHLSHRADEKLWSSQTLTFLIYHKNAFSFVKYSLNNEEFILSFRKTFSILFVCLVVFVLSENANSVLVKYLVLEDDR